MYEVEVRRCNVDDGRIAQVIVDEVFDAGKEVRSLDTGCW